MPGRDRISDILLTEGVVPLDVLERAQLSRDRYGGRLLTAILALGMAPEARVLEEVARGLRIEHSNLSDVKPDAFALRRVDVRLAERHAVFPIRLIEGGRTLVVAMADPLNLAVLDELSRKAQCRVLPVLATEASIEAAILRHYHHREPDEEAGSEAGYGDTGYGDAGPESVADAPGLGDEARARIATLRANQEKLAAALGAVRTLLAEKGLLPTTKR